MIEHSLLIDLEDRYVNGIVAYRLSEASYSPYFNVNIAWEILKNKPVERLTGQECYYLAKMKPSYAIECYELAIAKGYTKASLSAARFYGSVGQHEYALTHYEEAIAQQCPCAMYEFAAKMYKHPAYKHRCKELLKKSASAGHKTALYMCENLNNYFIS